MLKLLALASASAPRGVRSGGAFVHALRGPAAARRTVACAAADPTAPPLKVNVLALDKPALDEQVAAWREQRPELGKALAPFRSKQLHEWLGRLLRITVHQRQCSHHHISGRHV